MTAVLEVIESQRFIMGEQVAELEQAIASLCAAQHGIACASGTDALLLPLKALELAPGDEVITTPFTFFATAGAIANSGGKPVFVDIDPDTFNIDPDAVEAAVTPRTRAIVPVHLFGQMAPTERLQAVAERHSVRIIEDAAQAIGARQKIGGEWRMAGELSWASAFSFFPSKNLGCWGDGGMMVTSPRPRVAWPPPTTANSPRGCGCCAPTAAPSNTTTRKSVPTAAWTRCRPPCSWPK